MVISLADMYWEDLAKGFSLGFIRVGTTESALLGVSINKTPFGTGLSADLLYMTLMYKTVLSFINLFREEKKDDYTEEG